MTRQIIIVTVEIALSSSVASAPSEAQTNAGAIASACERVVRTFLERDGEGAQLTAAGQQKVASLFAQRGALSTGRVSVVSDDVVVGPVEHAPDSRMRVMLEYIYLGALTLVDTSYDNRPGGIKSRNSLVLSAVEGAPASPACQIEGAPPQPQLTLSGAIRHVTTLRDSARDAVERRRLTRAERPGAGTAHAPQAIENHREMLDYPGARQRALPIGSGNTEATCTTLFTVRMKRSGARRKETTAAHVIHLPALALSDRWEPALHLTLAPLRTAVRVAA